MTRDQRGKGGFGTGRRKFPKQRQVVIHGLMGIWPPTRKANRLFCDIFPKRRRAHRTPKRWREGGAHHSVRAAAVNPDTSVGSQRRAGNCAPYGALERTRQMKHLFHFFHHQHFDGHVGGNQFETG